jgi:hypothetical protein
MMLLQRDVLADNEYPSASSSRRGRKHNPYSAASSYSLGSLASSSRSVVDDDFYYLAAGNLLGPEFSNRVSELTEGTELDLPDAPSLQVQQSQRLERQSNRILKGGNDTDSDDEHDVLFELAELCATAGRLERNVDLSDQDYIDHDLSWNPVRQWLQTHSIEEELLPALQIRDENGKTAVHFLCQHQPPMDIMDYLLNAYPSSFQAQDVCGWTALHYACAFSAPSSVLQSIAEAWSKAKVTKTIRGLTPLHLALIGPFREYPDVIATLASTGASRIVDNQGLLVRWIVIAYLDEVRKEDKIHLTASTTFSLLSPFITRVRLEHCKKHCGY